jgi:hypothetical protein
MKENKDFITLADIGHVDLEEVLGVVRNKVNIMVSGRVLGSVENYLELGFGKERDSKALVLELLEGVKEDGDTVVHGGNGFV